MTTNISKSTEIPKRKYIGHHICVVFRKKNTKWFSSSVYLTKMHNLVKHTEIPYGIPRFYLYRISALLCVCVAIVHI